VVWRAAALDAMTALWQAAAPVLADAACALRYEARLVVGLVPCLGATSPLALAALVEGWHAQISAAIGPVSGGRSSGHAGQAGLTQAINEAVCALEVGDRVHGPGHLTAYGEIFVLDYATRLVSDHRLADLYDRVPSRLRTFDEAEGAELLPTLETFLAQGSVHSTASRLNVHRNTVLYRLKRIEEITRVDLDEPETRFLVQLALRAHRQMAADLKRDVAGGVPWRA
jgi:DNA-binding PucR family transcriptional regulator